MESEPDSELVPTLTFKMMTIDFTVGTNPYCLYIIFPEDVTALKPDMVLLAMDEGNSLPVQSITVEYK